MRRAALVVLAWVAAAAPGAAWASGSLTEALRHAGVSGAQARRLVREARADRVPAAAVRGWAEDLAGLRRVNLPVSLAVEQVFEGLVKGVPPAGITKGLRVFGRELKAARRILDRHATSDSLAGHPREARRALSDLVIAHRAGLRASALDRLLGARRLAVSRVSVYVQVAADLRGWGMARGKIVRILGKARRMGVRSQRLLTLDATLAGRAARGERLRHLGGTLREGLGLRSPMGPGSSVGPGGMGGPLGGTGGMSGTGPGGMTGPGGGITGPGGGITGPGGGVAGPGGGVAGPGGGAMGRP